MQRNNSCTKTIRFDFWIKKITSVILVLAVTVGFFIPVGNARDDHSNATLRTSDNDTPIAEEPWTIELLDGDLTLDQLKNASLSNADLPPEISRSVADERGHVNRLYAQEPDDYTVMFQNRDGSKTVYIFSFPVKNDSGFEVMQLGGNAQTEQIAQGLKLSVSAGAAKVVFPNSAFASRLGNSFSERPIFDYNIGRCDVILFDTAITSENADAGLNITNSAREWGKATESAKSTFKLSDSDCRAMPEYSISSISSNENVCVSVTYSSLAGEYALKHNGSLKYLTNMSDTLRMQNSIYAPYGKWLFEYQTNGSYTIRSQCNQEYYLVAVDDSTAMLGVSDDGQMFWYYDSTDGTLSPNHNHALALSSSLTVCDIAGAGSWALTNHVNYVDVSSIVIRKAGTTTNLRSIFGRVGEWVGFDAVYYPSNATYKGVYVSAPSNVEFDDSSGDEFYLSSAGEGSAVFSYQYNRSKCRSIVPTLVASSGSPSRFGNMIFEFGQGNGYYVTVDDVGNGVSFLLSQVHMESVNSNVIKRRDDYSTQFYIQPLSGNDLYTVKSVKNGKYLSVSDSGTSPVMLSSATSKSTWRILELADGQVAAYNPETTQLLGVDSGDDVVTGINDSETGWDLRIAGVYKLKNSSTQKYMTVEGGYDTDPRNGDNPQTVNIITGSENANGSLEDLDSNQHFRIVYNNNIAGYLLFPICSMNGSRRVIGQRTVSEPQVILKNYGSAQLDRVGISYAGSGTAYSIKLGTYAMTDVGNMVKFNSYSASASNQKWTLEVDYSRMDQEIMYANMDVVYPISTAFLTITSGYGYRIYDKKVGFHYGVDLQVNENNTLFSPFDGIVVRCDNVGAGELGKYLVIRSSEQSNLYVHLFHLNNTYVSVGTSVSKGSVIGVTGNTGVSGGAHLHMTFATTETAGFYSRYDSIDPLWFYSGMIFNSTTYTDSISGKDVQ